MVALIEAIPKLVHTTQCTPAVFPANLTSQLRHWLHFQKTYHLHLDARDYGGILVFHLLVLFFFWTFWYICFIFLTLVPMAPVQDQLYLSKDLF